MVTAGTTAAKSVLAAAVPGGASARTGFVLAALILIGGTALSLYGASSVRDEIMQRARADYDREAEQLAREVRRQIAQPASGLAGLRALFGSGEKIDRGAFARFAEVHDLRTEYPSAPSFAFIQRVQRADLPRFLAEVQNDGMPHMQLKTSGNAPDLYVIRYIEPLTANLPAVGVDIAAGPGRRQNVEQAVDSGHPVMTELVPLLSQAKSGLVHMMPVYRYGSDPVTVEQRRQALVGILTAPVIVADALARIPEVTQGRLAFELSEGGAQTPGSRLISVPESFAPGARGAAGRAPMFGSDTSFAIGGQMLTLRAASTPVFEMSIDQRTPRLRAVGGTLLSMALALAAWLLASGRREAEALTGTLSEELARLAMVARHTSNAVVITDAQRRITWVNDGFTRVTGYSAEEALGKSPGALLQTPETDAAMKDAMRAALLASEGFQGQLLNRSKTGRDYWVELEIQPLHDRDGRFTGFMAIETDVTERRQAELRLKTSEALLDRAGGLAGVGGWRIDLRTRHVLWSAQTCRIHDVAPGYQPTVEEGISYYEPQVRPAIEEAVRQAIADGTAFDLELPFITARGRHIWVRATGEAEYEDGRPARLVGAFQDVTARREAEQALRDAKSAAEDASASKSRFLANMSHEIRTPMNAVLGMLNLLQRTPLDGRQRDYADKTEAAARSLLGLLNDILDFSKIEAGRLDLDIHPFRPDRLLRDLSVIVAANADGKPIDILFDIDPQLPELLIGDGPRLRQVLINLASNAIKFTQTGHVILHVREAGRRDGRVDVHFDIVDTGIGIAADQQAAIFSAFTQAEASTARRFGGTGLGLAISRRLVDMMGGKLAVSSTAGQGSSFSFTVPLGIAPDSAVEWHEPLAFSAARALIVDDNPTARDVLARMARTVGWDVDTASNGPDAIAMCASRSGSSIQYNAVFIDWLMPQMDGWETARRIRSEAAAGDAPMLVMLTGSGREIVGDLSDPRHGLFDGFVVKPVTASMLHDALVDARASRSMPQHAPNHDGAGRQRRLDGLRVLVVDDNDNNLQIALELLESESARVTVASNGEQALNRLAAAPDAFDAVLMDVQMPVMDGYAATAAIRNRLELGQLPIIAMTANVAPTDREACLAAGMNEHMGKPLDFALLVTALLRLTGRDAQPDDALRTLPPRASSSLLLGHEVAADAAAFDVDIELAIGRMGGSGPIYTRAASTFLRDLPSIATRITLALAEQRTGDARRELHTLKGIAATLGIRGLARVSGEAEAQMSAAGVAGLPEAIETTLQDALLDTHVRFARVVERLQRRFASAAAPALQAMQPNEITGALTTLDALLAASDMHAIDAFDRLRAGTRGNSPPIDLAALDDAVASLDFAAARAACRQLQDQLESRGRP